MKEEKKKQINYLKDWIKTDLKNKMQYLNAQDQIAFLNQQLDRLYTLGLLMQTEKEIEETGSKICNTIMKYREEQNKQEKLLEEPQQSIVKNATNIYEHLMKEL